LFRPGVYSGQGSPPVMAAHRHLDQCVPAVAAAAEVGRGRSVPLLQLPEGLAEPASTLLGAGTPCAKEANAEEFLLVGEHPRTRPRDVTKGTWEKFPVKGGA